MYVLFCNKIYHTRFVLELEIAIVLIIEQKLYYRVTHFLKFLKIFFFLMFSQVKKLILYKKKNNQYFKFYFF